VKRREKESLRQCFIHHLRQEAMLPHARKPINRGRELFTTRRGGMTSGTP